MYIYISNMCISKYVYQICVLTLLPRFFKKHNKSKLDTEQQTAFTGLKIMWSVSVK